MEAGGPPTSIINQVVPEKEAVEYAKKIWRKNGFFGEKNRYFRFCHKIIQPISTKFCVFRFNYLTNLKSGGW